MERGQLWVGAEVRFVGSPRPGLPAGSEGRVEQVPGEHSTAPLTQRPVPWTALLFGAEGRLWPVEPGDLELIIPAHPLHGEPDGSLADWLLGSLAPVRWVEGGLQVSSFVPATFPAVARVLHPWGDGDAAVPWREVAADAGVASVVELAESRIGGELPVVGGFQPPQQGQLDTVTAAALVQVLVDHTSTPDDVMAAGIWWPADRSWVVSTEIDYEWTFVAGSEALVEAVLAHPDLEARRTTPQAPANRLDGDLPA